MKEDRLRKDADEIHNLDDLVDARSEQISHFAKDRDALDEDVDIPDDMDVEEALTFPHPKRKRSEVEDIDLMDTPHEDEIEDDQVVWEDEEFLPSDYSQRYNQEISTHATDNEDEVAEEELHDIAHIRMSEISGEMTVERMPNKFTPDEITDELESEPIEADPDAAGKALADERTREEMRDLAKAMREESAEQP